MARRDHRRVGRRLYRQQLVDGVYRLDEGALLDDGFHFVQVSGVMGQLEQVDGSAIQRERVPFVQYVLLSGVQTLFGLESMNALPAVLCSDEALMRLVGFNAHQMRDGVCQRGAAKRQHARAPTPIWPDTLANNMVKCNLRALEAVCHGVMRALATAGVFGKQVTGLADGTDVETTKRDAGCGQATRKVRIQDTRGQGHEIEVTVYGWKVLSLIDAATPMPLAVKVGKSEEHETQGTRALLTQARTQLAGVARLHNVVVDRGFWDGSDRWGLDQQGLRFVVPAQANMAVTADARAQAAAGDGMPPGRRGHTVRHGQGRGARTEQLETAVVGITRLTTEDQDGTPAHGRYHNRRDFQPTLIHAVVIRQCQGKDDGPGGQTVFLTNASVEQPWRPFDDSDDRRLLEHCCIKEAKQQWNLGHPPQKTERAVRVQVRCPLRMVALATTSRRPCERKDRGGAPVGWPRWRRHLVEGTRDRVIVFAQGYDGIFHLAEYSLLLGVRLKDVPPGIGTHQNLLAKSRLTKRG